VGFDIDAVYVETANRRIAAEDCGECWCIHPRRRATSIGHSV
jgi:hypothetical protein